MKIISFIEREEIIKKILKHLGLWEVKSRLPPKIHPSPAELYAEYGSTVFAPDDQIQGEPTEVYSQIPPWDDDQTTVSHPTYCVPPLLTKIQHYYHEHQ
jgi:hypothetical protein